VSTRRHAARGNQLSADGAQRNWSHIRLAGLDFFLPKPVKPAALRALISRYVELQVRSNCLAPNCIFVSCGGELLA